MNIFKNKILVLLLAWFMIGLNVAYAADFALWGDQGNFNYQTLQFEQSVPAINGEVTAGGFRMYGPTFYGSGGDARPNFITTAGPAGGYNLKLSWRPIVYRGFASSSQISLSYGIKARYVPSYTPDANANWVAGVMPSGYAPFDWDNSNFEFGTLSDSYNTTDKLFIKNSITDADAKLILCVMYDVSETGDGSQMDLMSCAANPDINFSVTPGMISALRDEINNNVIGQPTNDTFWEKKWNDVEGWTIMEGCNLTGPAVSHSISGSLSTNYTFDSAIAYRGAIMEGWEDFGCGGPTIAVTTGKLRERGPVDLSSGTAVCGNGVVETGEQCELPNTATCDASCQTIVGPGPAPGAGDDIFVEVTGINQCGSHTEDVCVLEAEVESSSTDTKYVLFRDGDGNLIGKGTNIEGVEDGVSTLVLDQCLKGEEDGDPITYNITAVPYIVF